MKKSKEIDLCTSKRASGIVCSLMAAGLLALSGAAHSAVVSDEMHCSINGLERKIYIQLENIESPVPCEVMENKDLNAPDSAVALWSAGADPSYCRTKLDGYVEKLIGLGFACWSESDSSPGAVLRNED